jgi:hypothetical protein
MAVGKTVGVAEGAVRTLTSEVAAPGETTIRSAVGVTPPGNGSLCTVGDVGTDVGAEDGEDTVPGETLDGLGVNPGATARGTHPVKSITLTRHKWNSSVR